MTVPTPPRFTSDPSKDSYLIAKYLGDIYRALVTEDQLPGRASRTAKVSATAISKAAPSGTKVIALTPVVLGTFTDPPSAAEMEALRKQVNALSAAVLSILQAAQLQ